MDVLHSRGSDVYAVVYFGVIIVLSVVESWAPRRQPGDAVRVRWFSNFALAFMGTAVVKLTFPVAGGTLAVLCESRGWGLFHYVTIPRAAQFVITILAIDATGYCQHYLLHRSPLLWRIHRTHHSDHDYDFSTGARFHPIETVYTTSILLLPVLALGAPPEAVFLSQIISTISGFIEHGNLRYGSTLDRVLRWFVVTPNMHRIHHSRLGTESQTNYGGTFSWWDRLCGTYLSHPAGGYEQMTFGLDGFLERKHLTLPWMLAQPFISEPSPADRAHNVPAAPTEFVAR